MIRKKYQVFTPKNTVNDMLDYIGYAGPSVVGKKIIDLSCGDGAFLCLALERLIAECKKQHLAVTSIIKISNESIYGIEIDKRYYTECIKKLNTIITREFGSHFIKWNNVINSDGLRFKKTNFDFVVGNPPYISYRDMDESERDYLRENFEGCKSNRFDYSYAFVEKSLSVLSNNGKGCLICPINMYKIKSGELIKNILRPYLSTIVDVTEDNIFPGVLTNPVISVFDKQEKSGGILLKKKNSRSRILNRNSFESDITVYLSSGKKKFGDYFEVHSGVATLFNEAFIVDNDIDIEKELLKNACSPRFSRYQLSFKIIFPYECVGGQIKKITEECLVCKYPRTYNHLLKYKGKLLERKTPATISWFEYGRTQALKTIGVPKIMMPAIMSEGVKPILLGEDDVVFAGLYIVSKDPLKHPIKEAFDILSNNKLLYNYIKHFGVKMNGGSYRYGPKVLEKYKY